MSIQAAYDSIVVRTWTNYSFISDGLNRCSVCVQVLIVHIGKQLLGPGLAIHVYDGSEPWLMSIQAVVVLLLGPRLTIKLYFMTLNTYLMKVQTADDSIVLGPRLTNHLYMMAPIPGA